MSTRMVVGVDGSDSSARAVEWCARYAAALGGEVVAVHAIEEPIYPVPSLAYVPVPAIPPEAREEIRRILEDDWCKPLADAGIRFRAVLLDGPPAATITRLADDENADLIVTGSRGRGGFAGLLLGSTSQHLSHHTNRPLVIVP